MIIDKDYILFLARRYKQEVVPGVPKGHLELRIKSRLQRQSADIIAQCHSKD